MNDDPGLARSLREFRGRFHGCLRRRAHALFELADAVLTDPQKAKFTPG